MRVEKLSVRHWRNHESLDLEFSGGLNAVIGRIGSGKSSIMAAMKFALLNELDDSFKNEFRQISPRDAKCEVIATVAVENGISVVLSRSFRWNSTSVSHSAEVIGKDQKVIERGATDASVRGIVSSYLGPPKAISAYAFVGQDSFKAWIQDTDAERSKWFAKLIDIHDAEKIHATCQKEAALLTSQAIGSIVELEASVDAAKAAHKDILQQLKDVETELGGLTPPDQEMVKKLYKAKTFLANRASKNDERSRFTEKIIESKNLQSQCRAKVELLALQLEQIDAKIVAHSDLVADAKSKLAARQAHLKHEQARKQLTDAIKAGEEQLLSLQESRQSVDWGDWDPEVTGPIYYQTDTTVQNFEEAVKSIRESGDSKCPTCLQTIANKHLKFLESTIASLRPQLDKMKASKKKYEAAEYEVGRYDILIREKEAGISNNKARLEAMGKSKAPISDKEAQELEKICRGSEDSQTHRRLVAAQLEEARSSLDELGRQIATTGSRLEEVERWFESMKDVSRISNPDIHLEAGQRVLNRIASLTSVAEVKRQELSKTEADIKAAEEKIRVHRASSEWAREVEPVFRFFHRSEGPREVCYRALQSVVVPVNRRLEALNAEFTVDADENLSFQATGKRIGTQPAKKLSGGQKTQLSFSLWMGLQDSRLPGLSGIRALFLDEPTQGLDRLAIMYLRPVMEEIHRLAVNSGMQIIMVTHEKALFGSFGTIIDLDSMDGNQ